MNKARLFNTFVLLIHSAFVFGAGVTLGETVTLPQALLYLVGVMLLASQTMRVVEYWK